MSIFLKILYCYCGWKILHGIWCWIDKQGKDEQGKDDQGKDDLNCDNESLPRNKSRNGNPSDDHAINCDKLLDASKVPHKPTILPSSSSYSYVVQSKTVNFETNKTADQKWSQNFSPISSQPSPSSSKPPSLSKQTQSSTKTSTTFSKPSPSLPVPPPSSSKLTSPSSLSSSSSLSTSSFQTSSFPKPPTALSNKPTLSLASSNPKNDQTHTKYIWVQEGSSPTHVIPEGIKELIKEDVVPGVLKKPLSPLTYKDYFHALLYAEDYYLEVHRKSIFISPNIL
ncbi:unnamed protein product [Ilex paraguariensis]|uniref:Uncharacterized protein n=1 Tax=Ilex paraguariensis TaxID=185542 RepID=A0ABC8QZ51_9AQUA